MRRRIRPVPRDAPRQAPHSPVRLLASLSLPRIPRRRKTIRPIPPSPQSPRPLGSLTVAAVSETAGFRQSESHSTRCARCVRPNRASEAAPIENAIPPRSSAPSASPRYLFKSSICVLITTANSTVLSHYLISFFSFSTSLYNFSILFRIFSASSAFGYKSKYL